eukprot:g33525.t1
MDTCVRVVRIDFAMSLRTVICYADDGIRYSRALLYCCTFLIGTIHVGNKISKVASQDCASYVPPSLQFHQIRHLLENVSDVGPVVLYWCFRMQRIIGRLVSSMNRRSDVEAFMENIVIRSRIGRMKLGTVVVAQDDLEKLQALSVDGVACKITQGKNRKKRRKLGLDCLANTFCYDPYMYYDVAYGEHQDSDWKLGDEDEVWLQLILLAETIASGTIDCPPGGKTMIFISSGAADDRLSGLSNGSGLMDI